MKLISKTLSIVVLLTSVSNVCAQQQPRLKGKVTFDDPQERGSQIKISVKNIGTGKLIHGQQESTRVEDWYHVADLNALVDVEFDGGGCYMGDGHPRIRVSQENDDLQKVILQKTRECRLKELRQATSSTTTNAKARTGSTSKSSGGARSVEETVEAAAVGEVYVYARLEAGLIPSPEVLKRELEADAAHARNGEFFDTFQYKFALKSELYKGRPELMRVLTDFKANTENSVMFKAVGQVRPEMFTDVVRRELQSPEDVNLENVIAVVKEESVSQNIRGTANVALLSGELPDDKLTAVTQYYRQQTPSSPIFETSLVGLLRIGEVADRATLFRYITDGPPETSRIAMEALSLATLIKGREAFPDGSKTLAEVAAKSDDPWVRAFAFRSLRPFVVSGDRVAFKALEYGSRDSNPEVRVQVALALGAGTTEQNDKAEYLLRNVLLADKTPEVRDAARLALSGKPTTDWFSAKFQGFIKN